MKYTFLLLSFLCVSLSNNLLAQTLDIPQYYELKLPTDYEKYEEVIVNASKWLKETPLNAQMEKRKEANSFVVEWVNGSPKVFVEINGGVLKLFKKNNQLLPLYMAGCARFCIEQNNYDDYKAKYKAALTDLIEVYTAGKGVKKDSQLEKLIKIAADNKLGDWIDSNFIGKR